MLAISLMTLAIIAPAEPMTITPEVLAKLHAIAFQAARTGDAKTLKEYFTLNVDVNKKNERGDTLLVVAAYNGQPEMVELILVQPKLDVDGRNGMGLTALTAAVFKGDEACTKLLIDAKADFNFSNKAGRTSLMFAAVGGRAKTAKLLLDAGADANAKDHAGNTALSLAKTQGADDVVKLLEGK